LFRSILIANRGEIALRIVRACKELGIRSVAVHSEADFESLHVQFADTDICIGAAHSSESYLHIPSIISAAEIADVEAIHPGYGFLSENAHFAEICRSCNIAFIGPSVDAIRLAGNKLEARKVMRDKGIPVVPGSDNTITDAEEALEIAHGIGFPVIIKAALGGGGRGMRIAHNDVSLVSAFMTAQSEAEAAFGDRSVYLEKCIESGRHIEFQVLGDRHGNVVHLGERECTIQRRYQKLIEEAPSTALDSKLRKEMGEAAIEAAHAVGYDNAGTIEFLLNEDGRFYFLELNSRIQVEHPVTEAVTGMDIVKEQIRLAAGEKLGFTQRDVRINGWAIESRIFAEDPDHDFRPCPGQITQFNLPGGPGIRVDTHVWEGYTVPTYYDAMLAKVVAWGRNRHEALRRAERAMEETVIEGVRSTVPLNLKILRNQRFQRGDINTKFLEASVLGERTARRT
jgi:acetyl-CoA carboxylase biotin carboxylase subunit